MNNIRYAAFLLAPAASAVLSSPQTTRLPLKPAAEESVFFSAAISIFVAAALLALAFYGLVWLRKRLLPGQSGAVSEFSPIVKNTRRLSQKTTLVTVVWQGKMYLLAESQGALSVLDSVLIEDTVPVEVDAS